MAFTLVQAGTKLYAVNTDGGRAELTLPTGVTLSDQRVPRFARFKRYAVLVNTPTKPLLIGTDGTVYPLTPAPPGAALVLASVNGGTLSGTYTAKYNHRILDALGNVVTQSDYSPISNSITIATKFLGATGIAVSTESITDRRLYRPTTSGSTYFPWIILDGNTLTSLQDDTPDTGLGTVEAPTLGTAPDLTLIVEWAGRLWGVDRVEMDDLRWTETGTAYAWNALNTLPIPHVGADQYGIMALIPRRNALGVARLNTLLQVTGSTLSNIKPTTLKEECGCVSQESVVVYKDQAFFLWRDGVYKWDDNGVVCVSDLGNVRSWFSTDTYFNRSMFPRSFAVMDVDDGMYTLFLASAGSNKIDRWVKLDLDANVWWGPHKTDAFHPTSAFFVRGSNGQPYDMVGSKEGILSLQTTEKNDWGIMPISMDIIGRDHDALEPEMEKFWGELSVSGKPQTTGTVLVTPSVGDIDNIAATAAFSWRLVNGRQRLGRVGFGQLARLRFTHATQNQDVLIYGYELPFTIVGRR